jgi:hypothetical protein
MWCAAINYFNNLEGILASMPDRHGEVHDLAPVGKCIGANCVTIGYSIIGDSNPAVQEKYTWIDDIMKKVSKDSNLVFKEDVKKLTVGSVDKFFNYLEINPNSTLLSVVWCTSEWMVYEKWNVSLPCHFSEDSDQEMMFYTLWYNRSLAETYLFRPTFVPAPKDKHLIFLQQSIDNAILEMLHERNNGTGKSPRIESTYSDYPEPLDRLFKGMEIMSTCGAYYFVLGPILTFMIIL